MIDVDRSLKDRAFATFEHALTLADKHAALADLHAMLHRLRAQLERPMTVAIVGRANAGRPTLTNTLLGERPAVTDRRERTLNANWFRHGKERTLRVHSTDGRLTPGVCELPVVSTMVTSGSGM